VLKFPVAGKMRSPAVSNGQFVVRNYASVGSKEPFTAAFLGLGDLVDAAEFGLAKQTEIKNIIMEIYIGLHASSISLPEKDSATGRRRGNGRQLENYDDLYRYLVRALKDRTLATTPLSFRMPAFK
jgi:hypothetical protein